MAALERDGASFGTSFSAHVHVRYRR
jgi:hypothetical protein